MYCRTMKFVFFVFCLGGSLLWGCWVLNNRHKESLRYAALLTYAESYQKKEIMSKASTEHISFMSYLPEHISAKLRLSNKGLLDDNCMQIVVNVAPPRSEDTSFIMVARYPDVCYVVRSGKRTPIALQQARELINHNKCVIYCYE